MWPAPCGQIARQVRGAQGVGTGVGISVTSVMSAYSIERNFSKNSPFIYLFIYLHGTEPMPPAVEALSQPTGPPGKSLEGNLKTNLFTP